MQSRLGNSETMMAARQARVASSRARDWSGVRPSILAPPVLVMIRKFMFATAVWASMSESLDADSNSDTAAVRRSTISLWQISIFSPF